MNELTTKRETITIKNEDLLVFDNPLFGELKSILIDGEPWFVAKNLADALGYSQTQAMTKILDDDELTSFKFDGMNMLQILINESGFYSVAIRSTLPNAKAFRKWVTSEVLPTIRKTGQYSINKQKQEKIKSLIPIHKELKSSIDINIAMGMTKEQARISASEMVKSSFGYDYIEESGFNRINEEIKTQKEEVRRKLGCSISTQVSIFINEKCLYGEKYINFRISARELYTGYLKWINSMLQGDAINIKSLRKKQFVDEIKTRFDYIKEGTWTFRGITLK